MRWTFTRRCFWNGALRHVGDDVEASISNPPPFTVASHLYKPVEPEVVERVQGDAGFVVRGEDGKLVPAGKATRLAGRSPNELRPFARD